MANRWRWLLILGMLTLGIRAEHSEDIIIDDPEDPRPMLRVGVSQTATPLVFVEDGVLRGLEMDLARELSQALDVELRVLPVPEPRLIEALRGGRIDLLLTQKEISTLHRQRLSASMPLFAVGQYAVVHQRNLTRFARLLDILISTARVGYQHTSTGARLVHRLMPQAIRVPFDTTAAGFDALRAQEIDLFVADAPDTWQLLANLEEQELVVLLEPLHREQLVWAVREQDVDLLEQIDAVITEWHATGRLSWLLKRWFPVTASLSD